MKVEMSFQFFPDEICNQFSICEAAKKASEMGEVGRIIAKAAGENIANRFNDDSLRVAMDLGIDYQKDNHFTELRDAEMLRERLESLDRVQNYVGE